jgi:transposase InsO family protein
MRNKSDVYDLFKQFNEEVIALVRSTTTTNKVIWIHSDCGEFNSQKVREYAINSGIQCSTTCPYSPEQNGVIERSWRTLGETATVMLLHGVNQHTSKDFAYTYQKLMKLLYLCMQLSPSLVQTP